MAKKRTLKTVQTLLYNKFRREGYDVKEAARLAKLNAPYYQRGSNPSKRKTRKRVAAALKKYLGSLKNPGKAKGRKVKGGRAVTLKNFSGTVTRKANGQVVIRGKGRK